MKIKLIWIGKTDDKQLDALINSYVARLQHYTPFEVLCIPDLKQTKSLTPSMQREKEGERIETHLEKGDHIILLDETGRMLRSVAFAKYLQQKQQTTARRLVFLIGGAYGFSDSIYRIAADKLSLSAMTFSHQLIRLLFVEQLYRAHTILKGEPYHHE